MLYNESPILMTKIAHQYKIRMTSAMLYDDFKEIKKLNQLFDKAYKNDNYLFEVLNQIKMLSNKIMLENLLDVLAEIIDIKYHQSVFWLVNNIDKYEKLKANINLIESHYD